MTEVHIQTATRKDPILGTVLRYTQQGWPSKFPEHLKPYWVRRNELTVGKGILMWGIRVIVPTKLKDQVLQEIHQGHPGINKMKQIARSHVWWPKVDADIETLSKACKACQEVRNSPASAPLHPWIWPTKPWSRVQIDFAGPFLSRMFLVAVDAYSKWPEVVEMSTGRAGVSAARTIEELRRIFSLHGLPQQIVSDNGPQFVSDQFAQCLKQNGVKHFKSSPYHPSSNELTERFI